MTDTSAFGEDPPPPLDGPDEGPPVGRAVALLLAFIVVTALLVGIVNRHPAASVATTATTATTAPHTSTTVPSGTTTTTVPKTQVPVLVANGSGAVNAATNFSNELQSAGWTTLPPVNATVSGLATSSVYYAAPVYKPAAQSIATTLHLPASAVKPLTSAVPVANVVGSGVVVVVGADLAPVSGSTTTTAAPVTTTTAAHSTTSTTKKT
ncbi:MAG TPA: LytR C-terminal domain-containing protein [Acidimicrobiales bacterium]|jgi:hypothetical protein|nr:LytR C-terminal domain-containing protein [Acidimicrobiales bacterium]